MSQVQAAPDFVDEIVIQAQVKGSAIGYNVIRRRVVHVKNGIALATPEVEDLLEEVSIMHMLECAKSASIMAMRQRDELGAIAGRKVLSA